MVNGGGNAPTSPTWRELFCALAQSGSRDEILVLHDALGYPQRGLKPSLEHFAAVGMIAGKDLPYVEKPAPSVENTAG